MSPKLRTFAWLALPAALLIAVASGWVYSRNSLFRLSDIVVSAEDPELAESVRNKLMGHLGHSLFAVSLAKVQQEVKTFTAVKTAGIHRRWPSTLVIAVEMRKPVAMMFVGGKLWSFDAEGKAIEVLVRPEALPLVKRLPSLESERAEVFAWIDAARGQDPGALDFAAMDELAWDSERGLIAKSYELDLEVELGFQGFAQAWTRADQAYGVLKSKGLRAQFLDATYRHRVVVRGAGRLQNLTNGLNLKELSHRAGPDPAQAR